MVFARFTDGACFIRTEAIYEIDCDKRATKAKASEATTITTSHGLKVDFDTDTLEKGYTRQLMTLASELRLSLAGVQGNAQGKINKVENHKTIRLKNSRSQRTTFLLKARTFFFSATASISIGRL